MIGKNNAAKQTLKFKLDSLLDITRAINDNQPVEVLLSNFTHILRDNLKIGKVVIYKNNHNHWACLLNSGASPEVIAAIEVERDLLSFTEITFVVSDEKLLPGFDIVIPVYNNSLPIAYVLIGDIEEEMAGISPVIKHLQFIQTISNIIVVAIENIRLFQESLKQEAFKKELELASQMQNMLIPATHNLPNNDRIRLASFYKPHYEVGGDYFDCIRLSDDEIGFCVADVSGKGLAAALMMSNFQATLHALFTSDIAMDKLLQKLNKRVAESAQGEKFITLFIARYNTVTHRLEYVNAGHTSALLYHETSKQLELLESSTIAMGMLDELPVVNVNRTVINEHSLLLSYTDGMVEVMSDTNEGEVDSAFYVLENAIRNSPDIETTVETIIEAQNLRGTNKAIFDDITLLGIEFLS
ncbi:MAG: PP2C family protein-serine/threonine phosphatase [Bacteroidales bacterium]|jgi:sigma-B regulation protein RsbU (phosphoserine phosphatase)|nr:PP2C family protein-serine/threonine phosphatase [Bacteroidales bacterium]